jgi:lambda family phage tail tape measure protein
MSETVDIGAARVRLIVDAADFQPVIDQGKNAIRGFGDAAQVAYDRTEKGTRRAADALLDYVNGLGRADSTMDKYLRNASRMGVEKPVLDAATLAWGKYTASVEDAAQALADVQAAQKRAQAGMRELSTQQDADAAKEKARANAAAAERFANLQAAREAQSQTDVNTLVAPGLAFDNNAQARREAAEHAFLGVLLQEEAAEAAKNQQLKEQLELENLINAARQDHQQTQAQQDFNRLLGIPEQQQALQLAQRRRDAEAAFSVQLQREADLEEQAFAHNANVDSFIKQLQNLQTTAGKSYYELLQLKAAELGVSQSAAPLIAQIKAQNQAMGAGTVSAKQYEFALRGLPAQFTDVVVSLQAGQNPLTVLLQQGGQVKDMFGGVRSAVGAVGKELGKLATNPWFLLAGAISAVAYAAYTTTSRMTELAIATAKGNQVAGSAQGLSTLSESLAKLDHITLGNADAAVTSLAIAGKLTGDNFRAAAQAAARWASVTGEGVDDIIGKFNELAANPMAAVENGTLRVTAAQYAQLEALDRVGDKVGEVQLAVKLYQAQINDNSQSVLNNLSEGAKGWLDLKDAISSAGHSLAEFITEMAGLSFDKLKSINFGGIAAGLAQFVTDPVGGAKSLFNGVQPTTPGGEVTRSGFGGVGTDAASISTATKLTLDQVAANKENQKAFDELGTKSQKYATQLALLNAQLGRSNDEFLKQQGVVRGLNGTFSGPGYDKLVNGLKLKVFGENQGGDPTKPIKQWEKTALDSLKAVQQATDFSYADRATSIEEYFAKSTAVADAEKRVQLESIDEQIAALKGRANSESTISALVEQRNTIEVQYASAKAQRDHAELTATQARVAAARNFSQSLADQNIELSRAGDVAAKAVGMGAQQLALEKSISDARYKNDLLLRSINQQYADQAITSAEAEQRRQDATAALSTQITILQGNYTKVKAAESDWLNGAQKAWADWYDNVTNYAQSAAQAFTTVMDDAASKIADAAMTGKADFGGLLKDIERQIIEFSAKQLLANALKGLIGGSGSTKTGDTASGLVGLVSLFSGSGFAKGAAFGGSSGLSGYSNQVVSQPTYFPFARGGVPNVGLMGEKPGSPGEAIMPLTRTSGGELAVKATGNQRTRVTNFTQNIIMQGQVNRSTPDQIASKTLGAATRAARRG